MQSCARNIFPPFFSTYLDLQEVFRLPVNVLKWLVSLGAGKNLANRPKQLWHFVLWKDLQSCSVCDNVSWPHGYGPIAPRTVPSVVLCMQAFRFIKGQWIMVGLPWWCFWISWRSVLIFLVNLYLGYIKGLGYVLALPMPRGARKISLGEAKTIDPKTKICSSMTTLLCSFLYFYCFHLNFMQDLRDVRLVLVHTTI